ncbi:MAG: deacylase [Alphaproteobacteria bacterium]|nr:deacylase [Alphaproteobacteria bacterium]
MSTRLTTDLDFDKDGKQVTYLRLPYSSNVSAYGWVGVPIAQIKNGKGPTVLFMAGNHGDEFEGQITLAKLIRRLDPKQVQGRLIVVPMANFPAAMAGYRTSPIDAGNLNRTFPGDPNGTLTQMIAHYIEEVLMPMCSGLLDMHSGGRTLHYIPSALAAIESIDKPDPKHLAAVKAFGAPIAYLVNFGENRTSSAGGRRKGLVSVGTELGGTGQVSPETLKIAEEGAQNMLEHFGLVEAKPGRNKRQSRVMYVGGYPYYVHAPTRGWFEPLFDLGDTVKAGQTAGLIQFIDEPMREPVPVTFGHDGVVICRRPPVQVERGDCIAHLATDVNL